MFGDGETFYHPVYIDNLVDAFELAGEKPGELDRLTSSGMNIITASRIWLET